jgi:hypothetical protein
MEQMVSRYGGTTANILNKEYQIALKGVAQHLEGWAGGLQLHNVKSQHIKNYYTGPHTWLLSYCKHDDDEPESSIKGGNYLTI